MERVGVLIEKLKEQFEERVDIKNMLVTIQLIHAELQKNVSNQFQKKSGVVVVLPKNNHSINHSVFEEDEIPNFIEPKLKNNKKEDQTGWLFDPIKEVPTLAHQDRIGRELNDLIGISAHSINDKLKEEKTELASVLVDTPIKDLRKAISVNDKHLFIEELFRGDDVMFERSIKTINGFNIYPEAEYWIQRELKVKIGWVDNCETVKSFNQLVKRRFI